ncbi:MAG TPA: FAD-dependent oxidoreductase [Mycobacteriales bacterium]|nr:FAD-dependent oxidoreductase [Mycobacteriales bacterium]
MRVTIVGAGPVGSYTALLLARRGHQITLVDRDPGPTPDGQWQRKGVMQFALPHYFRPQVRHAICEEVPELWSALLLAGGLPATPPGFPEMMTGLQCRRAVAEQAIWNFTSAEPGVRRVTGHADRLIVDAGTVTGVVVDGAAIRSDLVLVAGGRSSKIGDELRAPGEMHDCGFSYASRQYRARPGVATPDWGMPRPALYDGYLAIVFPQDAETISALIVRPTDDPRLLDLRHNHVFDAAAVAIPHLAEWTDPDRFEPITDVRSGSNLLNAYRGQRSVEDTTTPGVVFLGDAVLTTNPAAGRGFPLGLQGARELVRLLDSGLGADDLGAAFDDWCTANLRPWYDDHVLWDTTLLRRFAGEDLDLDARIPSDVVCECGQVDPSIMAAAGPYLGMFALPSILDSVQDKARDVLRTGWRPPYAEGPSRDALVEALLARV